MLTLLWFPDPLCKARPRVRRPEKCLNVTHVKTNTSVRRDNNSVDLQQPGGNRVNHKVRVGLQQAHRDPRRRLRIVAPQHDLL